jgi:FtsH-binding integral membrane protein
MFGNNYTDYSTARPWPSAAEINSSMVRVYNHMASGVFISGATAWLIAQSPALMATLFKTWLVWPVMLLPLAFVLIMSFGAGKLGAKTLGVLFYAYSIASGASLATVFAIYTGGSVFTAFFISSALFLTMSVYGYFTKRSLESLGQFLFIGLIGIVIAGVVNIFLQNSMMQMVISALAVIIFTGLTAYDTQQIREQLRFGESESGKVEILGALTLYLDFINIFINLLQLLGGKKDD